MPRLLFEKTGTAVWISHLDLMRLFQRAFKRAGLPLKHTQGYNPRPSVSIALPLSVGVESHCELLDFDLDGCDVPVEDICSRLNEKLVSGVRVLSAYEQGRKIRDLSLLLCNVTLVYDNGVPSNACSAIDALFGSEALTVPKKTKSGIQDQDIIPMIRRLSAQEHGSGEIVLDALICCQNPTLNPAQLAAAISIYLPDLTPDAVVCSRVEIFDADENVFR